MGARVLINGTWYHTKKGTLRDLICIMAAAIANTVTALRAQHHGSFRVGQ
jgi:hypothetical protein